MEYSAHPVSGNPNQSIQKLTPKQQLIVNFSLKKEVFFVVLGSIIGAFTMHLPQIFLDIAGNSSYYLTLLVLANVVNSTEPLIGFLLHIFAATIIGIVTGIVLHTVIKFKISKISHGLAYGVIAGIVVFVVFAIPVSQLVLNPNAAQLLSGMNPSMTLVDAAKEIEKSFATEMINSVVIHLIWGLTLGVFTSLFTRKFGANYLCHKCNIEFSKIRTWENHQIHVHENPSSQIKKILILGGGYSGIGVLNKTQKYFQDDVNVSISLVSESNFFLHTPMLAEMATGTIEPRHIATPIRKFCKRARFYQAQVTKIDLESKKVEIKKTSESSESKIHLEYDYLVIATGSRTNFFGNSNIEKNSLTIKSLDDAIKIRNKTISILEDADQEQDQNKTDSGVTFVVVGGGFSGVETAGELNEFIRESVKKYYRNISQDSVKVVLVASGEKILPEIGNLGEYAKDALQKAGVTIYTNTKLKDIKKNTAVLSTGEEISCDLLVWAGGNKVDDVILNLSADHDDRSGRLIVDSKLRLENHPEVFAMGDCAYVTDSRSGNPYPPTAQHAIRQANTVGTNVASSVDGIRNLSDFVYDTKGSMAKIGKRDGVALLGGLEIHGFAAWLVWKQYYLSTLPTMEKRIRVGLDWFVDLFFPRDITRLSNVFDQ